MYCLCRSSKTITVRIVLLDETDFLHELQVSVRGGLFSLISSFPWRELLQCRGYSVHPGMPGRHRNSCGPTREEDAPTPGHNAKNNTPPPAAP